MASWAETIADRMLLCTVKKLNWRMIAAERARAGEPADVAAGWHDAAGPDGEVSLDDEGGEHERDDDAVPDAGDHARTLARSDRLATPFWLRRARACAGSSS